MTEIWCFFYIFEEFCKDVPTFPQEMHNKK